MANGEALDEIASISAEQSRVLPPAPPATEARPSTFFRQISAAIGGLFRRPQAAGSRPPPIVPTYATPSREQQSDRNDEASQQNPDLIQTTPASPRLPGPPKSDPFDYVQLHQEPRKVSVELPITEITQWSVPNVLQAMTGHDNGQFQQSALLCGTVLTDPRIRSALSTRTKAITGLPLEFRPANDSPEAQRAADIAGANWIKWVPPLEAEKHHRWLLLMGFSLAQTIWLTDVGPLWEPRLNVWNPTNMYWFWDGYLRNFGRWNIIASESAYEPFGGDGQWVFAKSSEKEPWMEGLIRSLAIRYLTRFLSVKAWSRYNEKQGLATAKLIVPERADEADIRRVERQAKNIGSEPMFTFRQGSKESGNIWDFLWEECKAQGFETFPRTLEAIGEEAAIDILGQNLSSRMPRGGSYAAARVHQEVRHDLLEADAKAFAAHWRDQLLRPWALFNFGDPDLAPIMVYNTDPAPDIDTRTKSLNQLATAVKSLKDAGVDVTIGTVDVTPLVDDLSIHRKGAYYQVDADADTDTTERAVEATEGTQS